MTRLKLRSVNTHFWDDPYILQLTPEQKLMYNYLITTPFNNLAGVYEISLTSIKHHTGLELSVITEALDRFEKDRKILHFMNFIIMRNFMKHQVYNQSMMVNVMRTLRELPQEVQEATEKFRTGLPTPCTQGGDTPSAPSGESESESESEGEKEIEKRREKFRATLMTDEFVQKFGVATLNSFFNYWSEANRSGKKMRFEMQPTWEVGRRLATWKSREGGFTKGGQSARNDERYL